MGEKPPKFERRPEHVPADWLTRQQAQKALGNMTAYLLGKYMKDLGAEFPGSVVDLGPGKAAYLSPAFVDVIRTAHASVEHIKNVSGYKNRTEVVQAIEADEGSFFPLITENPPDMAKGEMRLLRNNNSQIFPYYSEAYVERLRLAYAIKQGGGKKRESKPTVIRAAEENLEPRVLGPAVNRAADILDEQKVVADKLVDLTEAQRARAVDKMAVLIRQLQRIERFYTRDTAFRSTLDQCYAAADALRVGGRMPAGLDRLFEKAERYLTSDE